MPINHQTRDKPGSQSNSWMSLGFRKADNDEEIARQKKVVEEISQMPGRGQMLQLEQIWRQIAMLNFLIQDTKSRETPGEFFTSTTILALLPAPGSAGPASSDNQVLPANRARRRVTLLATNSDCFWSHKSLRNVTALSSLSAQQTGSFAQLPMDVKWDVHSTGAIYAISNNVDQATTLTMVEEIYNVPMKLSDVHKTLEREERSILHKGANWIEEFV